MNEVARGMFVPFWPLEVVAVFVLRFGSPTQLANGGGAGGMFDDFDGPMSIVRSE